MNINGDFKMPRGQRQRERQKSNRLNRQNNYSARASRFFVHFFAVTVKTTTGKSLVSSFTEDVNNLRQQGAFYVRMGASAEQQ